MKFSFWVTLAVLSATAMSETILDGTPCENAVVCLSDSTFSFCFFINDGQEELHVGKFTCASGKECVQGANNPCYAALIEGQTKNSTSKSLVDSCETEGICKRAVNNCNQYYELVLQSCPSGESFSRTELKCTSEEACTGSSTETPSTQSSPANEEEDCGCTPPTCTGTGKYPSENCSQYYECIDTNTGYEMVIQTCPSGQAFNKTQLVCVVDEICGRENNSSGTTFSVASTTQATVVTPPTCLEPGRLPCQECNQYYECTLKDDGSFEISLETCPTGHAYSNTQQECVVDDTCIPIVTESTPPEVTPPTCTEPGRLPCQECNHYYECTSKDDGSFEISLETCPTGHAYSNTQQECVVDDTCIPAVTESTSPEVTSPTCTEPGRLPCQECNQYYECTSKEDGSFEISLETCPTGHAYSNTQQECVVDDTCIPAVTESTPPEVTPPTCTEPGRLPCQECNQYYECTSKDDGSFEISLETCPTGQAYSNTQQECVVDDTCILAVTESTSSEVTPPTCTEPGRLPCQECNQYYECTTKDDGSFEISLETCPTGHAYSNTQQECVVDDTCIPIVTESTPPEVTPPTCTEPGRLPCQECNQYYECTTKDDGSFEISLETCPTGHAYSNTQQECVVDDTCIPAVTESTPPEVTPPTCTEPGRLPCQECNHYYECTSKDDGSFEISLETCPTGHAYSNTQQECVVDDTCIPAVTESTSPEVTPPTCTEPGRLPCQECNQYYECTSKEDGSFEISLETCPTGHAYSNTQQECVVDDTCIPAVTESTPPEVTPPTCTEPGRLPCQECNQYYECTSKDDGSFEISLETCPTGQAYSNTQQECVVDDTCILAVTESTSSEVTPPTCTEPGRLPCQECNQYYECTSKDDGSFEISLETCPTGHAYSNTQQECVVDDTCIPIVTESTPPEVTPPTCTEPGRLPCQECNQYYECTTKDDGSFEISLETCPTGHAYSNTQQECVVDDTCIPAVTESTPPEVTPPTCTEPGRLPCQECNQYYECTSKDDGSFEISLETCPTGQAYSNTQQECVVDDTCILAVTESTSSEVTPPTCTEPGRLPCQECNQYYECTTKDDGSFEIYLETCPTGHAYSNTQQECVVDDTCIPIVTESTPPEVTPPTCTEPGRLPCQECNQYYECTTKDDGSFEISLETCPTGHAYSNTQQECVVDDTCIPAVTESTPPEVTPPTCTEPGRLPCQECNHYYECTSKDDGSFEISLETCPTGHAYSNTQQECVVDDTCIPAVTESTSPEVTPPTCTEPGRLPCQECNQYYECTSKEDGSFEISLETCPTGHAYSNTQQECVVDDTCIPAVTESTPPEVTPPTCTEPGRLPCQECNQYYECTSKDDGSFEISLETCPTGQAYSNTQQECVVDDTCILAVTESTSSEVTPPTCTEPGRLPCQECNQYYECTSKDDGSFEISLETCPTGHAYSNTQQECVVDDTCIPIVTESTPPEVTPPTCTEPGRLPCQECNQYYECTTKDDGSFEISLETCPTGHAYSNTQQECVVDDTCIPAVTESTPPEVTPPTCTEPGRLPCQECNQYYECTSKDDGSFEISLETCPTGHAYSNTQQECVVDDTCIPAVTESTSPEVTPPTCTEPGRLPCQECNQYYECTSKEDGSFEISLETCPTGHAYSNTQQECVVDDTCIPAVTESTPPEVTPPTCTEPGRLPCQECNQYYECTSKDDGSFEISLETCPTGQAYSNTQQECVVDDTCIPAVTESTPPEVTPPTCTEPGRLPCQECNQYYECTSKDDGSFEISLETCPTGHAYNNTQQECVVDDTCIPIVTESTPPEVTPPTCTEPGRLPCQECNQYYECTTKDDGSFEISLETCPTGHAYSNTQQECVVDDTCIPAVTESTSTEVTPPTCTELGRLPCQECNQYYECALKEDGSFEISLETCPTGHAYSNTQQECVVDDTCIPAVTESTSTEVTPPTCTELGRLPCQECNQYYECALKEDGSFEISLNTCPTGHAYSNTQQECVVDDTCIPAVTISTPTEVTPPTCTEPGRLPCQECNQYYECTSKEDGSFEISLETCPTGQAYSNTQQECVPDDSCIPVVTKSTTIPSVTPPTCTGPGRLPCQECNQYYECTEKEDGSFEISLETCSSGHAYNNTQQDCVPDDTCTVETIDTTTSEPFGCNTTEPEVITTTEAPVTAPAECTSASKYPSQNCNQYYECVQFLWWYFLNLYTCPSGQAFDTTELVCVANYRCNAETGKIESETTTKPSTTSSTSTTTTTTPTTTTAPTTTTTAPTTTTTTPTPTTTTPTTTTTTPTTTTTTTTTTTPITTTTTPAPTTTTPTTTVTTPTTTTPATTTTTPTTTTTKPTTTTTTQATPPSSCTGADKYPAPACNQYYECLEVMYWYELVVQTCESGHSYSECLKICVVDETCNP